MKNSEILLKAGDEGPWAIFRELADAFEEEGDIVLARGFRWLYEQKRWPIHQLSKDDYSRWQFVTDSYYQSSYYDYYVPADVYIGEITITTLTKWSDLVLYHAKIIGQWVLREEAKREKQIS